MNILNEVMNVFVICRNNASISHFGGSFQWQSEYPWCIIGIKKWLVNNQKYFKFEKIRVNEIFSEKLNS
ncbi:Uncharacterized protein FWK35_00010576 [Aphis craccivora]|uniref:Uncharacterized protein n=1 Tax=Aphis craccivora TaxID=307492 RepID=A0A6G0ZA47_APHCR|nr:Uncharacterized protein FWK35_00011154 [Aphis craccivora]KAF0773284.1 Uncharacterized protein FWK35_00010576 [Aphis craccivora]